jgi:MSHA pilin protein MshC
MSLRLPARDSGFTLMELVVVLVIVGIVGAVVAPRFISSRGFASRGFYDEAQAVMRFAQKTAIAWRRSIYVCVTATEISAISNNNCAAPTPVTNPMTGAALKSTAPPGVTLSPTGVSPLLCFNGIGGPMPPATCTGTSASATITLTSTISGDPARQIVVEAETGYVHR